MEKEMFILLDCQRVGSQKKLFSKINVSSRNSCVCVCVWVCVSVRNPTWVLISLDTIIVFLRILPCGGDDFVDDLHLKSNSSRQAQDIRSAVGHTATGLEKLPKLWSSGLFRLETWKIHAFSRHARQSFVEWFLICVSTHFPSICLHIPSLPFPNPPPGKSSLSFSVLPPKITRAPSPAPVVAVWGVVWDPTWSPWEVASNGGLHCGR